MIDRDAMLDELTTAMRRHHTRRGRLRVAGTLVVVAVAAALTLVAMPRHGSSPRPLPPPAAGSIVKVVHGAARTGLVRTIDDQELIDRLAEIDSPTGLIRTEGRVWLTDPPSL